jgi:hypothetical protein
MTLACSDEVLKGHHMTCYGEDSASQRSAVFGLAKYYTSCQRSGNEEAGCRMNGLAEGSVKKLQPLNERLPRIFP